ncbi:hypothetical protein [Oscillatoria acuminata]|nr:hypothetical protein [Oscillatoria acuminata]
MRKSSPIRLYGLLQIAIAIVARVHRRSCLGSAVAIATQRAVLFLG